VVTIERDVRVVASDGTQLSSDIYHPEGSGPFPTLLQRTCYGKEVLAEWSGIDRIVEAGYRVIMQNCRGSGISGGADDMLLEASDGRDTADWIDEQPWFDGRLGTFGASYMSFTQYALASTRPPHLKAMVIAGMGAHRGDAWYPGGSFALDIVLSWTATRVFGMEATMEGRRQSVEAAFMHLPLEEADQVAVGKSVEWYQDGLRHLARDDPFWAPLDYRSALEWDVPILMVDGWYDFALPHMLRDYDIRQRGGAPSRLMVGPWTHFSASAIAFDETIRWLDRHVKGDTSVATGSPVSVFVMPDVGCRDLARWPPEARTQPWYLQPEGGLSPSPPPASAPTPYTYDANDPTPSLGGPSLRMDNCGPVDNRPLEERDDVLTFTSEALQSPVEVVGPLAAQLYLETDVDNFDVYVRLCDVSPEGESTNLSDGILRINADDIVRTGEGTVGVNVTMWPTAQRFAAGHRIRLLLAGGAHPLFARNTCSGEPLATARTVVVAHNRVCHDPERASAILLPRSEHNPE
jgi:putative CocE/NonD family hydrolase